MKIAAIIMVLVMAQSMAAQTAAYRGVRYIVSGKGKALPTDVKSMGGSLIGDIEKRPLWGIAQVSKGKTQMLWLEKATAEDETGVTEWQISDVLAFPNFPKSHELLFGGGPMPCTIRGRPAGDSLVVHASFDAKRLRYRTISAWNASAESGRFSSVKPATVKCLYESP